MLFFSAHRPSAAGEVETQASSDGAEYPSLDRREEARGHVDRPNDGAIHVHEEEREEERRLIGQLAERIGAAVGGGGAEKWVLAAPQTINARLLEELDPSLRERMIGNEKHDFTKLPTLEVGRRLGLVG